MRATSYNLVLEPDTNTLGHTQWFYFRVRGMVPGVSYTFTIVNLEKPSSLFNEGMRPLMYISTAPGTNCVFLSFTFSSFCLCDLVQIVMVRPSVV